VSLFKAVSVDPCENLHMLSKPNCGLVVEVKTNYTQLLGLGLTQLPSVTSVTCSSLILMDRASRSDVKLPTDASRT
jgi:hypothetical protein